VGVVSGETETSDNTKTISVSVQQQNLYWLAKAIMSEASVGRQEERIAVGWTVLNRLESNEFPSTIKQVVESGYAYNQEP
jgi:spore germination cell wall hydrolase CwlJ-like protein